MPDGNIAKEGESPQAQHDIEAKWRSALLSWWRGVQNLVDAIELRLTLGSLDVVGKGSCQVLAPMLAVADGRGIAQSPTRILDAQGQEGVIARRYHFDMDLFAGYGVEPTVIASGLGCRTVGDAPHVAAGALLSILEGMGPDFATIHPSTADRWKQAAAMLRRGLDRFAKKTAEKEAEESFWPNFWARFPDKDASVTLRKMTLADLDGVVFFWERLPGLSTNPAGDEEGAKVAVQRFMWGIAAAHLIALAADQRGLDGTAFTRGHQVYRHFLSDATKLRPIPADDPRHEHNWTARDFLAVFPEGEGPNGMEREHFGEALDVVSRLKACIEREMATRSREGPAVPPADVKADLAAHAPGRSGPTGRRWKMASGTLAKRLRDLSKQDPPDEEFERNGVDSHRAPTEQEAAQWWLYQIGAALSQAYEDGELPGLRDPLMIAHIATGNFVRLACLVVKAVEARGCRLPGDFRKLAVAMANGAILGELTRPAKAAPQGQASVSRQPEPVGKHPRLVLMMLRALPPEAGMTGTQILNALAKQNVFISEGTLTSRVLPQLESYGLKNRPRIGYHLRPVK